MVRHKWDSDILNVYRAQRCLQRAVNGFKVGLRSTKIAVTPGKEYEASVYSYNTQGSSQLYFEFWDVNNTRILFPTATNSTLNQWKQLYLSQIAPAGAVSATQLPPNRSPKQTLLNYHPIDLHAKRYSTNNQSRSMPNVTHSPPNQAPCQRFPAPFKWKTSI
ncbi:hypothetical protein AB4114_24720 [Paenibacillus sp. 2RAB27]|uniref:hypothetical protein n=1 Tax=Paenibacillus sp. 2RAB27 TaxID=3232991 RepID=UPI003F94D513